MGDPRVAEGRRWRVLWVHHEAEELRVHDRATIPENDGTPICQAQAPAPPTGGAALDPASVGTNTALAGPWEFTFDGRIGVPTGRLKVGEFPTGSLKAGGGGAPGTLFRLRDLGIHVSGALEGSVAFHFTPRDAVRASYLYYFLRGSTTVNQSVVFNGQEFTAGSLQTNADFYRVSAWAPSSAPARPSPATSRRRTHGTSRRWRPR